MARIGKRFQVQLAPDVFTVLEEQASKHGVSRSAFISMLVMKYKTESDAISFLSKLPPEFQKMLKEMGET